MEELLAKLRELQQQQQQLNEQMAQQLAQAQQSSSSQGQSESQEGSQQGGQGRESEGQQESQGQQAGDSQEYQGDASDGSNGSSSLSEDQEKLGQRTSDAAEEVGQMPVEVGKSRDRSQVASELRRAAEYQSQAAGSIASSEFGKAQQSGGEGAASIAEAIAQLEDLLFAEVGVRNEADSFPPGYENLIQEYLRAISYE